MTRALIENIFWKDCGQSLVLLLTNLRSAVECEESEEEDEAAEGGHGHGVTGHVDDLAVVVEPAHAGLDDGAANQGAGAT